MRSGSKSWPFDGVGYQRDALRHRHPAETVAKDNELPAAFARENSAGVPDRAVLLIGGVGAVLAVIGSLGTLVEAASLIFLFTFATVNMLAWRAGVKHRWVSGR